MNEGGRADASSAFQLLLDFSAAIVSKKPQLESHWSRLVKASVPVPAVTRQAEDFIGMMAYSQLHLCGQSVGSSSFNVNNCTCQGPHLPSEQCAMLARGSVARSVQNQIPDTQPVPRNAPQKANAHNRACAKRQHSSCCRHISAQETSRTGGW